MSTRGKNKHITIGKIIIILILMIFSLACIIPILSIISISFSKESDLVNYGYSLIPRSIDLSAYKVLFKNNLNSMLRSYGVTIFVTVVGTFLSLFIMAMIAYPLSRPDFVYKKKLTFFVFFVLLFNGGLVPWYMVITRGLPFLKDTIWVMIIPYLANAWNILLLRTFFKGIPFSLIEAAKIDGSSEFNTFIKIIIPLSKPGLATIGTFMALQYWNDWWLPLLYVENSELYNLQYMLYKVMENIQAMVDMMNNVGASSTTVADIPTEAMRMAMCVIAFAPMLFVFPFVQKYFTKGLTVGSVKG